MLQVSDAIAARASLCENSLGQEIQVEALPKEVIERLASAKKLIEFGDQALTVLQWELGCMITIVPRTGQAYRSDNSVEAATGRCLLVAEVCRCHSICEKSGGSGNKN
jgi:hypothetical protein